VDVNATGGVTGAVKRPLPMPLGQEEHFYWNCIAVGKEWSRNRSLNLAPSLAPSLVLEQPINLTSRIAMEGDVDDTIPATSTPAQHVRESEADASQD